jgi:hypothetical protein
LGKGLWNQTITPIELTPLSLSHTHSTAARAIYFEGRERNKVEKREKERKRVEGREDEREKERYRNLERLHIFVSV